jgi:protein TonB
MPLFPGCADVGGDRDEKRECSTEKITAYVHDNLRYPEEAKRAGIQGRVVVQFNVEANGMISDIRCVRDIGYGCGAEAICIAKSMNQMDEKWTPGELLRGIPVRLQFTLPVGFKL